jgi:SAM-dependent methyltransferase
MNNETDYRELLLGCGYARDKRLGKPGTALEWKNLTTLDRYLKCNPDFVCDLDSLPWKYSDKNGHFDRRLPENYFDEVHAYEVMEHIGRQGDEYSFFGHFFEIWRTLKPGGHFFATVPSRMSPWAWGDPSHKRLIQPESLCFLDRANVAANRKRGTTMTDFRGIWFGDFIVRASTDDTASHIFCLEAVKPARDLP